MEENNKNTEDSRVYEVGYLLVPTLKEEEIPTIFGNLKELITSLEGEEISNEMPKIITLAYSMSKMIQNVRNKFDSAYFGWTKFFMDPEKVMELKKKLELDPNVLRFLIIKTVKENTTAAKRFAHKDYRRRTLTPKPVGQEEVGPINKEEVDKEIEALVAEN